MARRGVLRGMKRLLPLALVLLLAAPALAFTGRIINLGDAAVSAAVTNQVITSSVSAQSVSIAYVDRLEGITSLTFEANFTYAAGGTTLKVDLETSVDQGTNWLPICRIAFATASALKVVNISGLTPKTTAASLSVPADDACTDGVLGDRLRVRITSVGVYSGNSSISTRAAVR